MSSASIMRSFELAAEHAGDIMPSVYEAYFARCPESSDLMRLVDTHMRGRMLESVLQLFMVEQTDDQLGYLRFETRNHVNYGVMPYMYANLLDALRDTVRDACGHEWNAEMQFAWDERIAGLVGEIETMASHSA